MADDKNITTDGATISETGNPTSKTTAPEPVRTFRVLCGAVSGIGKNPKGEPVDKDFYTGTIVTEAQLNGLAASYVLSGSVEPIEA